MKLKESLTVVGHWASEPHFTVLFTFSASFVSSKSRFCLRTGTGRALCHTSAHMLPGIRMRKLRCPSSRHYERERRRRKLELDFRSQSVVTSRQIQHLAEGNYQTKNSNSGMQAILSFKVAIWRPAVIKLSPVTALTVPNRKNRIKRKSFCILRKAQ